MQGNPPRQRQRWGRQRQSPHHPRLWENHKRSLIGGPRKMGVQGGDSMENEAERPKFDLWLPPVPLWLLSGHPERSSPPKRRNSPSPARKRLPTEPCCGGYRKGVGFPSRASWGAANAPGWWRLPPPQPPRSLCPTPHKGAPVDRGTTTPGNPLRQRQRWGRQRQSPHHPRLWENHKRSLIGGPRKMGVQGGDSMENEAEGPKFDLWLPPVPLWLLSGHPERSSPPLRRNTPDPAP